MKVKRTMVCANCGKVLGSKDVVFQYYDHRLERKVPCCEECGQCYIDKDLARGKMHEAEVELEDK